MVLIPNNKIILYLINIKSKGELFVNIDYLGLSNINFSIKKLSTLVDRVEDKVIYNTKNFALNSMSTL